jgi:hypothetical protein
MNRCPAQPAGTRKPRRDVRRTGCRLWADVESAEELITWIGDDDQRAKEELFQAYGGIPGNPAYRCSSHLLPQFEALTA